MKYKYNKFDNSVVQEIPGSKIPSRIALTTIMAERQAKIVAAEVNDALNVFCKKYRCVITEYGIKIVYRGMK